MENRVILEGVVMTLTKTEDYISFALQNDYDIIVVYGNLPDTDIDVDMKVRVLGRLRRQGTAIKVEANSIMRVE